MASAEGTAPQPSKKSAADSIATPKPGLSFAEAAESAPQDESASAAEPAPETAPAAAKHTDFKPVGANATPATQASLKSQEDGKAEQQSQVTSYSFDKANSDCHGHGMSALHLSMQLQ